MKNNIKDELLELLKELKNDKNINRIIDKGMKMVESELKEAINLPCKITVEKNSKGIACSSIEGTKLSILTTLAGLEKSILSKIDCNKEEFEFIKEFVGSKDLENEQSI